MKYLNKYRFEIDIDFRLIVVATTEMGPSNQKTNLLKKKCWAKSRIFFSTPSAQPGTNERTKKITKWISKSTKAPRYRCYLLCDFNRFTVNYWGQKLVCEMVFRRPKRPKFRPPHGDPNFGQNFGHHTGAQISRAAARRGAPRRARGALSHAGPRRAAPRRKKHFTNANYG